VQIVRNVCVGDRVAGREHEKREGSRSMNPRAQHFGAFSTKGLWFASFFFAIPRFLLFIFVFATPPPARTGGGKEKQTPAIPLPHRISDPCALLFVLGIWLMRGKLITLAGFGGGPCDSGAGD
jgi:hypothetical protein